MINFVKNLLQRRIKINMKNKKLSFIIAGIVIIVSAIILTYIGLTNTSDADKETEKMITVPNPRLEDISGEAKTKEIQKSSDKDDISIDEIQGFSPKVNIKADSSDETESVTDKKGHADDETEENSIYKLSDERLIVKSVGAYTGNFVEDGSDDAVKGITAMVVTNHSDKMLQVGDISFQVTKKETASFRITNLMPHTSVLVLELNRRIYKEKDNYSFGTVATAWLDKPDIPKNKFEIKKENGRLTLVNMTDDTYDIVYVYYKYAKSGGVYMGGITYRVPFENVTAKASVESIANHFNKDSSKIIDVQILNKD